MLYLLPIVNDYAGAAWNVASLLRGALRDARARARSGRISGSFRYVLRLSLLSGIGPLHIPRARRSSALPRFHDPRRIFSDRVFPPRALTSGSCSRKTRSAFAYERANGWHRFRHARDTTPFTRNWFSSIFGASSFDRTASRGAPWSRRIIGNSPQTMKNSINESLDSILIVFNCRSTNRLIIDTVRFIIISK